MTKRTASDDLNELELLPPEVAQRRTSDLLRNLLNAPPDPTVAPKKPAKRRAKRVLKPSCKSKK